MRRSALSLLACATLVAGCSDGDGGSPAGTGGSGGSTNVAGSAVTSNVASSSTTASSVAASGSGGSSATSGTGGTGGTGDGAGGTGDVDASSEDASDDAGKMDAGPIVVTDGGLIPTPPGMTPIFDGATLKGWDGDAKIWSVKDGAIDGLTQNGGQLIVTVDDYDDFRITGTARMPQSDNHLGICFWGGRGGHGYNGCIDFVPPSGSIWDYGGLDGIRTYPYVWMGVPVKKTDWHQFEILANLTTGVVRMGVDGHEFPIYTDTRLAKRKKGPIGLQIHAGFSEVQYKDLAIQVNPTVDHLLTTTGPPTQPK